MSVPGRRTAAGPASRRGAWNGTPARSRFFDAISLLLPAAEQFLIETVEEWRTQAGDSLSAVLRSEVERFLREERAHQGVHQRYNEGLISANPEVRAHALRASQATDSLRSLDLATRMALVEAFEVLTAVLSREALERSYLLGNGTSVEARIWRWHAREELAHCHVAGQAVIALGVSRGRRLLAFTLATGFLLFDVLRFWHALCRCDIGAGAGRARTWAEGLSFLLRGAPSMLRMYVGWSRQLLR